jgi:hypothetical protein
MPPSPSKSEIVLLFLGPAHTCSVQRRQRDRAHGCTHAAVRARARASLQITYSFERARARAHARTDAHTHTHARTHARTLTHTSGEPGQEEMAGREQGTTVAHVQSPACLRIRGFCGAFPLHGQLLRG